MELLERGRRGRMGRMGRMEGMVRRVVGGKMCGAVFSMAESELKL